MNGALILCLVLCVITTAFAAIAMVATKGQRSPAVPRPETEGAYRLQLEYQKNESYTSAFLAFALLMWAIFVVLLVMKWMFG